MVWTAQRRKVSEHRHIAESTYGSGIGRQKCGWIQKNKRRRNFKKHLLADEDAIIRMVRENRGLAVRIRTWLDSLLSRLAATRRGARACVRAQGSICPRTGRRGERHGARETAHRRGDGKGERGNIHARGGRRLLDPPRKTEAGRGAPRRGRDKRGGLRGRVGGAARERTQASGDKGVLTE